MKKALKKISIGAMTIAVLTTLIIVGEPVIKMIGALLILAVAAGFAALCCWLCGDIIVEGFYPWLKEKYIAYRSGKEKA